MTTEQQSTGGGHAPFLTKEDEVGLGERKETSDADIADLTVHSDAGAIFANSMAPLRRPVVMVVAALTAGVVLLVGGGIVLRALRGEARAPLA